MFKNCRAWKVKYKALGYSMKLALLQNKRNFFPPIIRLTESLLRRENNNKIKRELS